MKFKHAQIWITRFFTGDTFVNFGIEVML